MSGPLGGQANLFGIVLLDWPDPCRAVSFVGAVISGIDQPALPVIPSLLDRFFGFGAQSKKSLPSARLISLRRALRRV